MLALRCSRRRRLTSRLPLHRWRQRLLVAPPRTAKAQMVIMVMAMVVAMTPTLRSESWMMRKRNLTAVLMLRRRAARLNLHSTARKASLTLPASPNSVASAALVVVLPVGCEA